MLCFARQWRVTWRGDGVRAAFKLLLLGSPRRSAALRCARLVLALRGLAGCAQGCARRFSTRGSVLRGLRQPKAEARTMRLVSLAARSNLLLVVFASCFICGNTPPSHMRELFGTRARRSAQTALAALPAKQPRAHRSEAVDTANW